MEFPLDFVRGFFPALADSPTMFFDNASGTQVPQSVVEAVSERLSRRKFERGGPHRLSEEVDELIKRARESLGAFVNAYDPKEVLIGVSASSLIRLASLSVAESFAPGDEVVVSELDHDANIAPWVALEKRGIN